MRNLNYLICVLCGRVGQAYQSIWSTSINNRFFNNLCGMPMCQLQSLSTYSTVLQKLINSGSTPLSKLIDQPYSIFLMGIREYIFFLSISITLAMLFKGCVAIWIERYKSLTLTTISTTMARPNGRVYTSQSMFCQPTTRRMYREVSTLLHPRLRPPVSQNLSRILHDKDQERSGLNDKWGTTKQGLTKHRTHKLNGYIRCLETTKDN